jgi:hypothetical protein
MILVYLWHLVYNNEIESIGILFIYLFINKFLCSFKFIYNDFFINLLEKKKVCPLTLLIVLGCNVASFCDVKQIFTYK